MKKIIGSVVLVVLILAGAALAFDNEPEGFRGLKWGDKLTEDMIVYKLGTVINDYTLPDEVLSLGSVTLFVVLYQFLTRPEEEVLMSVMLYFQGEENYDLMEIICKQKFGKESISGWEEEIWFSLNSMVLLKYDSIEEGGFLALSSVPLLEERVEAVEKVESEKAQEDW